MTRRLNVEDFRMTLSAAEAAALERRAIRRSFVRGQALCHRAKWPTAS
jgi:hypothetical protein